MKKQNLSPCPVGTADLLIAYQAARLDADTTIRLDRHVGDCPHCQEFLASQSLVWDALEAYEQATPSVSSDFDRLLYARIAEERQDSWWVRGWRRLLAAGEPMNWKPVATMAATCAVLMAGLLVRVDQQPKPVPVPVASVAFEKSELETIERALEDFEMLSAMGAPEQPVAEPSEKL